MHIPESLPYCVYILLSGKDHNFYVASPPISNAEIIGDVPPNHLLTKLLHVY